MDVPEGEIVVLVGPSGCGKTTTMKMINRIIEPTSGRIFLDGRGRHLRPSRPVAPPDRLRDPADRAVPAPDDRAEHRDGAEAARAGTASGSTSGSTSCWRWCGMSPEVYRDRYPKQLSGGQRQRVGVARALGGDPTVMLMDEPFGAIDPITRDRLQNEFLRLQAEVKKTIVFVTHDIDEAIKMGDRIAILREGSRIAQYDTPEQILVAPAERLRRRLHRLGRVAQAPEPEPGPRHRASPTGRRCRCDAAPTRSSRPCSARTRAAPSSWTRSAARAAGSPPPTYGGPGPAARHRGAPARGASSSRRRRCTTP